MVDPQLDKKEGIVKGRVCYFDNSMKLVDQEERLKNRSRRKNKPDKSHVVITSSTDKLPTIKRSKQDCE